MPRSSSRISKGWRVSWASSDGREHFRTVPSKTEALTRLRKEMDRGGVQIGEPVELEDRWFARSSRDSAGREHKKWFPTRKAAKDYLHDKDDRRRRNEASPRASDGRRLFAKAAQDVAATRAGRRASTRARDESVMASLILPTFGDVQLRNVSGTMVETWIGSLVTRRCAPATIRKAFQLLGGVMRYSARKRWLLRSPLEDVDLAEILPKDDHIEQRFLDATEIRQLAAAIDPRYQALVLCAAYTGARFGELAALRVERIDFLRRQIRIEETLNEVRGQIVIGPPKTRKARRAVSIPSFLADVLAAHVAGKPADGYVFAAPEGGPLRRNGFRRRFWQPAVRTSVGEPLRFHDLRHSHAALLIAEGVHPKAMADRLGHSSIRTTLDVYGHLLEGLDGAAADALDAMFRNVPATPAVAEVVEIGGGA
jgi:integrase